MSLVADYHGLTINQAAKGKPLGFNLGRIAEYAACHRVLCKTAA